MLCPTRECNGTPEVPRHGKLLPILNNELSVVPEPSTLSRAIVVNGIGVKDANDRRYRLLRIPVL